MTQTSVTAILLVTLLGCALTPTSAEDALELRLPPSLELALAPHKPELPVAAELLAVDSTISIDHKGNFGRIDTSDRQMALEWQLDGRLAMTTFESYKAPNGSTSASTITESTLCGLVPLLVESSTVANSQLSTAVPAGRIFVPFGFSANSQSAMRSRITAFTSTASNVCKPEPGDSFSYQATWEAQRRIKGTFSSSNKQGVIAESVTCAIGHKEASTTLGSEFRGEYLPVTCTYTNADKPPRKSVYAFLIASGAYIPVSMQFNEYQTNTFRYTVFKYK